MNLIAQMIVLLVFIVCALVWWVVCNPQSRSQRPLPGFHREQRLARALVREWLWHNKHYTAWTRLDAKIRIDAIAQLQGGSYLAKGDVVVPPVYDEWYDREWRLGNFEVT